MTQSFLWCSRCGNTGDWTHDEGLISGERCDRCGSGQGICVVRIFPGGGCLEKGQKLRIAARLEVAGYPFPNSAAFRTLV